MTARRVPPATGSAEGVPDGAFPADPYPGAAPSWSFVHHDARSHRLVPDTAAFAGWSLDSEDLDAWLARRGAAPLAGRVPVLAFGSNRCPSKLTWLREHLGLAGPVVVLRARLHGLAAVWAAGHRARDGARPATLAVAPGADEVHAVWMATPQQVAVLDVCEGRGERYDLVRLHAGRVLTEDGAVIDDPWTYWPADPVRAPLLVDGVPVRCSELRQEDARDLVGEAAWPPYPGVVTPEPGAPDPESWPARVFTYGTLQPGASAWSMVAPHARGAAVEPAVAWLPGRVHDTGRGYPALRLGPAAGGDTAHGTIVSLPDVAAALPALDEYEGPEYRRVRGIVRRGQDESVADVCWLWVWANVAETDRWPVVRGRWGAGPG